MRYIKQALCRSAEMRLMGSRILSYKYDISSDRHAWYAFDWRQIATIIIFMYN